MDGYFIEKNLPPVLSKEAQENLLLRINEGDVEAREMFIISNIRLVINRVIYYFGTLSIEKQELVAEGIVGLIKAVNTFDFSKGILFSSYATRCIDNEILMYLRKCKKLSVQVPFEEPIGNSKEGKPLILGEILCNNTNIEEEYCFRETLQESLKVFEELPEQDRYILSLYFGLNGNKRHNQQEIADICGISRSYVSRIIQKNLEKMRKQLTHEENYQKRIM